MAKPTDKALEYVNRAEAMTWTEIQALWLAIKESDTPEWEGGKALEHLVIRAFKLSGLEVEYPYDVPPGGKTMKSPAKLIVAVEGPADAAMLRAVLGQDLPAGTRFFSSNGRASLATLGRNLLVHEGGPVLLVMDADTLNPRLSAEWQAMTRLALRSVAPGSRFDVFAFVPEIEVAFFEAPLALERVLGSVVSEALIREGCLIPKQTLKRLLQESNRWKDEKALVDSLDPTVCQMLSEGKQIMELKSVIERVMAPAAVV